MSARYVNLTLTESEMEAVRMAIDYAGEREFLDVYRRRALARVRAQLRLARDRLACGASQVSRREIARRQSPA